MRIDFKKLKSLPVETENGLLLGHIINLEINLDTFRIEKCEVQDKKWIGTDQQYLISSEQIIKITDEKVIVQENVKKITNKEINKIPVTTSPTPTLNSEMER